jgi:hypothetical protein
MAHLLCVSSTVMGVRRLYPIRSYLMEETAGACLFWSRCGIS